MEDLKTRVQELYQSGMSSPSAITKSIFGEAKTQKDYDRVWTIVNGLKKLTTAVQSMPSPEPAPVEPVPPVIAEAPPAPALLLTKIPGPNASSSKMRSKGWKCWAKLVSGAEMNARNGYGFEGNFLEVGASMELEAGDVVLHYDNSGSNGIGVVVPNSKGAGRIVWLETDSTTGWALSLSRVARMLLDLPRSDRVHRAAEDVVANAEPDIDPTVLTHYRRLAGKESAPSPRDQALEQIKKLMAEHGITTHDLT